MPGFPYASKERITGPKKPLNGLLGINVTASEQTTLPSELCGGQNVFTDVTGSVYNRPGSLVLGGTVDTNGVQGGWVYRDNFQRYAIIEVVNGVIYSFDGSKMVALSGAPTLNTSLAVNGVFYPDNNKFYLTNGTDSVVELDQSTGTLIATSRPLIQKCLYIGYHDHHLIFLNLPTQPNVFAISDQGTTTTNSASVTACQGFILGMANMDLYTAVLVTDQRAYRMTGINSTYDASNNLVFSPNSFLEIGKSRAVAPRSILMVNNSVYWVGLDDFNGAEIYRTDGQQILPIGWTKLKTYLRLINTAALANACATQYGYYAKFCVPSEGNSFNNQEILLDTARSVAYTESGAYGPPQIIFEPKHITGYTTAQYATWKSGGQDYVLAFDAQIGAIHRQGVGIFDELPFLNTFPVPGSSPTTGSITVTPTTPISQPFTPTTTQSTLEVSLRVSAFSAGSGSVVLSFQTDSAGSPSGVSVASVTVSGGSSTLPKVLSASLAASLTLTTPYHLVVTPVGGNLTVTKISTATLPLNFLQKSGSVWSSGTGNPIMLIMSQTNIDASFVHTTSFSNPVFKKKIIRWVLNGTSVSGALMTLGVGNQGRDGTFVTTDFNLSGSNAVWGVPGSSQPTNVLIWAAPSDVATSSNTWSSSTPDYDVTVFGPWYQIPSNTLSFQFRSVSKSDWRINYYNPLVDIIPTSIT